MMQSVMIALEPPSTETPEPAVFEKPLEKVMPSISTLVVTPVMRRHLSRLCPKTVTAPPPAFLSVMSLFEIRRFSGYKPGVISMVSPSVLALIAAVMVMKS